MHHKYGMGINVKQRRRMYAIRRPVIGSRQNMRLQRASEKSANCLPDDHSPCLPLSNSRPPSPTPVSLSTILQLFELFMS
jgi:hypothetical protein